MEQPSKFLCVSWLKIRSTHGLIRGLVIYPFTDKSVTMGMEQFSYFFSNPIFISFFSNPQQIKYQLFKRNLLVYANFGLRQPLFSGKK